jgi:predicted RNase H-like nuclease
MPIARSPFAARRAADDAISREFGSRWCSAHTPNSARPGPLGERLSNDFSSAGFTLVTSMQVQPLGPSLIEVYPHPALLSLLGRNQRVPYKVSKAKKYWPALDISGRISSLLQEFDVIFTALTGRIGQLPLELPDRRDITSLSRLKRYEDALDALICAWVGIEYIEARTVPLGDQTAAIWCPADVIRTKHGD